MTAAKNLKAGLPTSVRFQRGVNTNYEIKASRNERPSLALQAQKIAFTSRISFSLYIRFHFFSITF